MPKNSIIAGIDEAGRGALAGPVLACAVVVIGLKAQDAKSKILLQNVKDSKKLTVQKREMLYKIIITHSGIWRGVGKVSEKVIDKINIKNAAELAMEKAVKNLEKNMGKNAELLIIDGNQLKNKFLKRRNHQLIVKADSKVFACSLASIIAKVERDRLMQKLHKKHPEYNFASHKGYGTKEHYEALIKCGKKLCHRESFNLLKR